MRFSVVRVYHRGLKLSERELRSAEGVIGDVRIQIVQQPDGRSVREAICIALTTQCLPRLLEPQLVGISIQGAGCDERWKTNLATQRRCAVLGLRVGTVRYHLKQL